MDCQKHLFSLPDDHHYLNGAYLSPLLKAVEQAGIRGIREKKVPWQTAPADFFSDSNTLRSLFAKLINAPGASRVAIIPSVSYGMSTVAKNLPGRTTKKVVVAGEQFPSNVYPWKRYCRDAGSRLQTVPPPEDFHQRGKRWNERIIDAIDEETLMVAISNNHWADGTLFDLQAIGEQARRVGAWFVIDGTQSVGALPFDVQQVRPDALVCAGYKWLMGPYALGLAWFGERMDGGRPLEENWITRRDSEDFSALLNYSDDYQPGAVRFDMGERSNFILVPMMIKALEQILAWGPDRVQGYCRQLTRGLARRLPERGYRIEDPDRRAHHLFGIRLPDRISKEALQQELAGRNIHVSVRGSAVRISPNVYNDERDIEALQEVLVGL